MPSIAQTLQQAIQIHNDGGLAEAERVYRSIIRIDPKQPDALHLLGVVQQQLGNAKAAADYIERAVAENPRAAVFHGNLAAAYQSLGQLESARERLEDAIRIDPDFVTAHFNLGTVLKDLNRPDDAIPAFQRVIELDPSHVEGYNNLGAAHAAKGDWDSAITCYRDALQFEPRNPEALINLGLAMSAIGKNDEARKYFKQAISSSPMSVHLGNWHRDQGEAVAAEASYRQALTVEPDNTMAINNLGLSLKEQGRYDEAMACFERVLQIDPEHVEAHVNRSFIHRLLGNYPEGWADYDRRFEADSLERTFSAATWTGESLAGQTILVHVEMGVGDQVQFASCLPEIADGADRCVLECDPRLVPLFARSFPQVEVVSEPADIESVPHDFQIPIGSVAQYIRPTLDSFPARTRFLVADSQRVAEWRNRFRELPGRCTVGISWCGGSDAEVRRKRSTSLAEWLPLFALPGIDFVTLQHGDHAGELARFQQEFGTTVHDWNDSDPLADIDGFAAQMAALDLVISVDNTNAHLAGGLGIPCWTLLAFDPDWRWGLNREDCPWYPSMRLFRQSQPGDWSPVIQAVQAGLSERVDGSRTSHTQSVTVSTGIPKQEPKWEWEPGWDTTESCSTEDSPKFQESKPRQAPVSPDDQSWLDRNASLRWNPAISTTTGERGEFHLRRYEFAMEYCRGKRTLDVACGTGYGTSMLARVASEVCGIDQCGEAAEFASRNYGNRGLSFRQSYAELTPFDDDSFDTIVCFEALEHMLSARATMREFVRLLTADGLAIVSVPNCWGHTVYHLSDPDLSFLKSLCNEFFSECEFFYNNSGDLPSQTGSGIGPLDGTNVAEAECLIAVCRQPRLLSGSQDQTSEMLSDFYTEAFDRHRKFLKLQLPSASALPVGQSADNDAYPEVVAGRPLALTLDINCDYTRVLIRLDAEIVDCRPGRATIAIPEIPLSGAKLAQLQLISRDGETVASEVVRLVSAERSTEQSGSCDSTPS